MVTRRRFGFRSRFLFRDGTWTRLLKPIGGSRFVRFVPRPREATLTVQTSDLRRSRRNRVLMRATLISTDGAQDVRVKDLTSDGAGVCCQVPLERGTDVILKRGDLFVAARVVWADGMTAGLEFYRPLEGGDSAFLLAGE